MVKSARFLVSCLLAVPLWAANSVEIYETGGNLQTNRVITMPRFFAAGEIPDFARPVVEGVPAAEWQCDRRTQWPGGSLQWAFVSFKVTLVSRRSVTVTFQNSVDPCSSGNGAACDAAGLDKNGMISFASGEWGGKIEASQNSTIHTVDVRTMIGEGHFTYLLRGPVVTQVLAEDLTSARTYDFGWSCVTDCTGDYSSATWVSDMTGLSLHPRFVVTFPSGFAGVRVQPMVENTWTTAIQDQRYALSVKDKLNHTEAEVGVFTHWALTRRSKGLDFWDLKEPRSIRIDHNLKYLVASRVIPSYDLSVRLSSSAIADEKADFARRNCAWGAPCSMQTRRFASAPEAGFYERWVARYLYSFDDDMREIAIENCQVSESVPIHYRESDPGRFFVDLDEDGSSRDDGVDAFGRVISIDAWGEFRLGRKQFTDGADRLTPLAPLSKDVGWQPDSAHQPSFCVVPYLTEGEHYMLEEIQFWAARNLGASNYRDISYGRHGSWGFLTSAAHQIRGQGWAARTIGYAGLLSTGVERIYFQQKLMYHAAVLEGFHDIRDGTFRRHPVHGEKWRWGRDVVGQSLDNPLNLPNRAAGTYVNRGVDSSKVCLSNSQFMYHFKIVAEGWLRDVGYRWFDKILEAQSRLLIEQALNTADSSPYLGTTYHIPVTENDGDCSDGSNPYFSSVAGMYDALKPETRDGLKGYFQQSSGTEGYAHKAKAAAAVIEPYSYNGKRGSDVWNWYLANVPNQKIYSSNPRWAIVPRPSPVSSSVRTPDSGTIRRGRGRGTR